MELRCWTRLPRICNWRLGSPSAFRTWRCGNKQIKHTPFTKFNHVGGVWKQRFLLLFFCYWLYHHNRFVAIMLRSSSWIHKTAWSKTVQFFPVTASSKVWKRTIDKCSAPLKHPGMATCRNTWHPCSTHWSSAPEDSWWKFQGAHRTRSSDLRHLVLMIRLGWPQAAGSAGSAGVTCHGGRSTFWANGSTKMWSFCEAHSMSIHSIPCLCQVYTIMVVPCKNIYDLCHVYAMSMPSNHI